MAEIQMKAIGSADNPDELVLMSHQNGSQAWISTRAASIEQLALPGSDGQLVKHVFGHADRVAFLESGARLEAIPDYSRELHIKIEGSMRSALMGGGVPLTFLPGRLQGGQIWFEQSPGNYKKFAVPVSHPQFQSLLHLGDAKTDYFMMDSYAPSGNQTASVSMYVFVGNSLRNQGFPGGILAKVNYELFEDSLVRKVTITNESDIAIAMPTSDHGSYSPDNCRLGEYSFRLSTNGEYSLDSQTKIALGSLEPSEMFTGSHQPFSSPLETMVNVGLGSRMEILNLKTRKGLLITPDKESEVVYIWTHNTGNEKFQHNFLSLQPYSGGITAALSAPAFNKPDALAKMHPSFNQQQFLIEPGKSKCYTTTWSTLRLHQR